MKSLIIAKSNLKKFKGLSICLSILILISAMFITALCLLETDFKSNIKRNADDLNSSDAVLYSYSSHLSEDEVVSILPDDVIEYYYQEAIITSIYSKYGDGSSMHSVYIEDEKSFDREISKVEIVKESSKVVGDYIYLPYQFHTGGGINLLDDYTMKINNTTYTCKVKGFINSTFGGCNNVGSLEIIASDSIYNKIILDNDDITSFMLYFNLNDNSDIDSKINRFIRDTKLNYGYSLEYNTKQLIVDNRGFMGDIFVVMFLTVAIVIILVTMLSIYNNINNYLRENLKTLGILKAIGYTSNDIRKSILLQFFIITFAGTVLGILAGYLFMPMISSILVAQSGLPYNVSFNLLSTLLPLVLIPVFIYVIIFIALIRVKKIEAVNALKDSNSLMHTKVNHFKLEKTKAPINIAIALKNLLNSLKQNIISFLVLIFVSLSIVTAVTFYENFDRNPKLSIMTLEYCEVGIVIEDDYNDMMYEIMKNDDRISSLREVCDAEINDKDYGTLYTLAMDDMNNYYNKEVCYEGRFPKNSDEVLISGSYAKRKKLKVGDKIYLSCKNEHYYTISGLSQSVNNGGNECVMTIDGLKKIDDTSINAHTYYFEVSGDKDELINDYKTMYGDNITEIVDFEEIINGALSTFRTLSESLVLIISVISAIVISLVLYILLRTLIYKRRFEYGILKAQGFTSGQLIIQNVLSFTPLIILGSVVGTIISYHIMNPFFTVGMSGFGIMKCNLKLPLDLITITPILLVLLSVIVITIMSLKIKKIEPYKLLIQE